MSPQLAWALVAALVTVALVLLAGGSVGFAVLSAVVAGLVAAITEDRILNLADRPRRNRHVDID